MPDLEKINLDLSNYKILLRFKNRKNPLSIHFDKPARKFYFSLIALVVNETKNMGKSGFIFIRKHESAIKFLDAALAGQHASHSVDGLWEKVRKSWRYTLPDLETTTHFKIEDRDLIQPYEKGGRHRYDCTDEECDIWANLFQYDENNKWRFKFAIETANLNLEDIEITYGAVKGDAAWKIFIKDLEKAISKDRSETKRDPKKPTVIKHQKYWLMVTTTTVAIIIFLVTGAIVLNHYFRLKSAPDELWTTTRPSIAVLPFVNISDDPEKEYFCDGVTEELINKLARIKDLRVISRTSAFYFKDKGIDLRTIGEKLNVDHVIEGSVRVSGDQLRISVQLINVKNDSHLWAEAYDRKMIDIFDTQEKLAQEIACSLRSRLGCNGDDFTGKHYTENVEAYNLYLKGRYFWNQETRDGDKAALDYFEKAIKEDPNFAIAYVGISDVYSQMAFSRPVSAAETYKIAKKMTLKALEIDSNCAEAYASLGLIQTRFEWDWVNADRNFKNSIEINPNYAFAARHYGDYLRAIGRLDDAIEETKRGLTLDPLSTHLNRHLGIAYRFAGEYDKSIVQLQRTLELEPNNPMNMSLLGNFYRDKAMYGESIAILEKALSISPNHPMVLNNIAKTYADYGNRKEAVKILNQLIERAKKQYFSPHIIAMIYQYLGLKDKAFEWLEKGYNSKDPLMFCLKTIPDWKPLHSDPRWAELMKKMGLDSWPN